MHNDAQIAVANGFTISHSNLKKKVNNFVFVLFWIWRITTFINFNIELLNQNLYQSSLNIWWMNLQVNINIISITIILIAFTKIKYYISSKKKNKITLNC